MGMTGRLLAGLGREIGSFLPGHGREKWMAWGLVLGKVLWWSGWRGDGRSVVEESGFGEAVGYEVLGFRAVMARGVVDVLSW